MSSGSNGDNHYEDDDDDLEKDEERYSAKGPRAFRLGVELREGPPPVFLRGKEMPRLHPDHIAQACDNIVAGRDCYASLIYLGRVKCEDVPLLFQATQSHELRVRWERLWVLSPYFARISRLHEGRVQLLACMRDDLPALHLISKFTEHKSQAVMRLFKRLKKDLTALLLEKIAEFRNDQRRADLISSILEVIEGDPNALQKAIDEHVPKALRNEVLPWIRVREKNTDRYKRLSPKRLLKLLRKWSER